MNGGVYVHVPFCRSRCAYCSFYSVARGNFPDSGKYARAIIHHLSSFNITESKDFDTIYFGGGTPSLMPASFFSEVIEGISMDQAKSVLDAAETAYTKEHGEIEE